MSDMKDLAHKIIVIGLTKFFIISCQITNEFKKKETPAHQNEFQQTFQLYKESLNLYMESEAYKNPQDELSKEFNTSVKFATELTEEDINELIKSQHFGKFDTKIEKEFGQKINWNRSSSSTFESTDIVAETEDDAAKKEHSKNIKNSAIALVVFGSLGAIRLLNGEAITEAALAPHRLAKLGSGIKSLATSIGFLTVGSLIIADDSGDSEKTNALKGVLITAGSAIVLQNVATGIGLNNKYLNSLGIDTSTQFSKALVKPAIRSMRVGALFGAILGAGFIAWGSTLNLTKSKSHQEQLVDNLSNVFGKLLDLERNSTK